LIGWSFLAIMAKTKRKITDIIKRRKIMLMGLKDSSANLKATKV
jgi:hypothetical protein